MPVRVTRRAFTFIELLVVVGMIGVGVALLPGPLGRSREAANRIKCSSNLRQIALGIKMYTNNERNNQYPRTRVDVATADKPTAYTKPEAANPFLEDGPEVNDVTAALFLVLRTQEITTDVFVCPSTTAERLTFDAGKTVQAYSNFTSQRQLSYSYANPYALKESIQRGYGLTESISADFAIMSDLNPGGDAVRDVKFSDAGDKQRLANSRNHKQDGQNVLYADAHVDWSASPWAGTMQDNIFTFRKEGGQNPATAAVGGIEGSAFDDNDSILLPAFDEKVGMPEQQ